MITFLLPFDSYHFWQRFDHMLATFITFWQHKYNYVLTTFWQDYDNYHVLTTLWQRFDNHYVLTTFWQISCFDNVLTTFLQILPFRQRFANVIITITFWQLLKTFGQRYNCHHVLTAFWWRCDNVMTPFMFWHRFNSVFYNNYHVFTTFWQCYNNHHVLTRL